MTNDKQPDEPEQPGAPAPADEPEQVAQRKLTAIDEYISLAWTHADPNAPLMVKIQRLLNDLFYQRQRAQDELSIQRENTESDRAYIASLENRVASLTAENEAAHDALRSLASFVGAGGYNAPKVDAKLFEEKIRWGLDHIIKVERGNGPAISDSEMMSLLRRVNREFELEIKELKARLAAQPPAPQPEQPEIDLLSNDPILEALADEPPIDDPAEPPMNYSDQHDAQTIKEFWDWLTADYPDDVFISDVDIDLAVEEFLVFLQQKRDPQYPNPAFRERPL